MLSLYTIITYYQVYNRGLARQANIKTNYILTCYVIVFFVIFWFTIPSTINKLSSDQPLDHVEDVHFSPTPPSSY